MTECDTGRKHISNRRRGCLGCFVVFLLALYGLCWLISGAVWHMESHGYVAEQVDWPEINGVDAAVWANPTQTTWSRSAVCPFLRYTQSEGPHVICVRWSDPAHAAKAVRVHAAHLESSDGEQVELILVDSRDSTSGQWLDFYKNASEFIVHMFHSTELDLPESFTIVIEVSIENNGEIMRDRIEIRVNMIEKITYSGIQMPT